MTITAGGRNGQAWSALPRSACPHGPGKGCPGIGWAVTVGYTGSGDCRVSADQGRLPGVSPQRRLSNSTVIVFWCRLPRSCPERRVEDTCGVTLLSSISVFVK